MRISKVEITNFRAIEEATVELEPLTSVIGANNTGKSAFLKAIDLFFGSAPKVEDDDFHNGNLDSPIDITVSFQNLTPDEQSLFETNLIDGRLTVTRRLVRGNPKESGSFFVEAMVNPEFSKCRNEEGKKARTEIYKELQEKFEGLANVKSADEIDEKLEAWEALNPEALSPHRVGSFRGWKNVAVGQLKKKTDFLFVPAVKEAAQEAGDGKSPVKQLVDTLAKQTIENDKTFRAFTLETNDRLKNFTDPANVPALKNISGTLTTILKKYYADSDLIATWEPITEFPISFPSSQIEVKDHGFQCGVARVGHGLQRAIIITILEFLASERLRDIEGQEENFEVPHSDIIVAIEEPEIYQHPIKQRHITDVLAHITESFNKQTGIRIQVLLATHSPLFVRLPRFQEVRISRRAAETPNQVRFSKLTLSECSAGLADLHEPPKEPMKDTALAAKLHVFTSDLSEGFFGTKVVLVEGLSDKAVLEASLTVRGRTATSEGLTILAVGGKKILDKPAFIFRALGIPTYVVFDNDKSSVNNDKKDSEINYNRFMQRLLGVPAEDLEDWPSGVHQEWAAWDGNLEKYLVEKCSAELYGKVKAEMMAHFEVSNDDCVKSPTIAGAMLTSFVKHNIVFDQLDQIIEMIDGL